MSKEPDGETALLLDIKKLLIVQLLAQGVQQGQIAVALGISDATMSRMLPKGFAASLKKQVANG